MNPWRLINPLVSLIARSPFHFLISHQLLVISFEGTKSGKQYLVPLSYHQKNSSYICVTLRSNIWWRNLKGLSNTKVWFKGCLIKMDLSMEFKDDQLVEDTLRSIVTKNRIEAFIANIKLDKEGIPLKEELLEAAKLHTVLKFNQNL